MGGRRRGGAADCRPPAARDLSSAAALRRLEVRGWGYPPEPPQHSPPERSAASKSVRADSETAKQGPAQTRRGQRGPVLQPAMAVMVVDDGGSAMGACPRGQWRWGRQRGGHHPADAKQLGVRAQWTWPAHPGGGGGCYTRAIA